MHRYRHLMVGLSRTEADPGLIRYAAMVARLGTATKVRFFHVLPNNSATASVSEHDRVQAEMQSEVRTHFIDIPETTQIVFEVLTGPLVDRLLTCVAEKQVDLLVVGHQRDHLQRNALARRLAMKAPCSVWLAPNGAAASLRRILVPIDFSEHSADTMRVATSMANLSGHSECLALHVYFDEARVTYEESDQVLRGHEEQAYRQFIAPINCQGVTVTPIFEESVNVPRTIAAVAERHDVDLIVMATRGRSRSSAILLGSVTEEMIIETKTPLLAVKHFGARLGVLQALLDRTFRRSSGVQFD
jgi:sulfate permease, SulP family